MKSGWSKFVLTNKDNEFKESGFMRFYDDNNKNTLATQIVFADNKGNYKIAMNNIDAFGTEVEYHSCKTTDLDDAMWMCKNFTVDNGFGLDIDRNAMMCYIECREFAPKQEILSEIQSREMFGAITTEDKRDIVEQMYMMHGVQ